MLTVNARENMDVIGHTTHSESNPALGADASAKETMQPTSPCAVEAGNMIFGGKDQMVVEAEVSGRHWSSVAPPGRVRFIYGNPVVVTTGYAPMSLWDKPSSGHHRLCSDVPLVPLQAEREWGFATPEMS